jgi:Domain of unknown function (DUF5979)
MGGSSRRRARWVAVAALALGLGVAATSSLTLSAGAQQGNAGDVKLHDIAQSINNNSDNPKPCNPVLVSFNFEIGQKYTYEFVTQGGPGGGVTVIGPITVTVTTDPQQEPPSGDFAPPLVVDQLYKLRWDFGESLGGGTKQKVFRVTCGSTTPTGSFAVTKTVSGTNAPTDFAFTVHIICTGGFEGDVILSDENPTATVSNLGVSETCTVTELDSQGATVTYSAAQTSGPVTAGGTVAVTVNNDFTGTGSSTTTTARPNGNGNGNGDDDEPQAVPPTPAVPTPVVAAAPFTG